MLGVLWETFITLEKGKAFHFIGRGKKKKRERVYFTTISSMLQIRT